MDIIKRIINASPIVRFHKLGSKYIEISEDRRIISPITPDRILNKDKCFRASNIYDLCPMQEYIYYKRNEVRTEVISSKEVIAFQVGHVLHDIIRKWIKNNYLWGYWECKRCNLVIDKLTNIKNSVCLSCGGETNYYEVDILYDNFGGSIDAFIGEDIENLKICDIKSANADSFGDMVIQGKVSNKYLYQINSYIYLSNKKFPDLNIRNGVFIIFNKSSGNFFDIEVQRDDNIIQDILQRIEETKNSILNDRRPNMRICKNYNDVKERKCKVYRECFYE